jgi:hypothetical protein
VPDSADDELKQQEDDMDPITAMNLEFAQRVKRSWSSEPSERCSEQATPALYTRLFAQLRALAGSGLAAFGMRLQGQQQDLASATDHS